MKSSLPKSSSFSDTLYASDMNLAQHAWEAGDIRRVRELLQRHRPHPGESDLRRFEWHYLNRLCHQELLTLDGRSGPADHVAYSPDGKRLASAHRGLEKTPWSGCGTPRPGESCSPSRAWGRPWPSARTANGWPLPVAQTRGARSRCGMPRPDRN